MIPVGFCASTNEHRLKGQALCLSLGDCQGNAPEFYGFPYFSQDQARQGRPLSGYPPGTAHGTYELPEALAGVPFAEKIAAGAAFEKDRPGPWLWVDEEVVFLEKPAFPGNTLLAVNPVDLRNIGEAPGARPDGFWRILLDRFGLGEGLPALRTTVTGEAVRGYYNAGMILVRENRQAFAAALEAMTELMASPAFRRVLEAAPLRQVFFHQAVLSCVLLSRYPGQIGPLPKGQNLPYHLRESWPDSLRSVRAASIRYDDAFDGQLPEAADGRGYLSRMRAVLDRETQT